MPDFRSVDKRPSNFSHIFTDALACCSDSRCKYHQMQGSAGRARTRPKLCTRPTVIIPAALIAQVTKQTLSHAAYEKMTNKLTTLYPQCHGSQILFSRPESQTNHIVNAFGSFWSRSAKHMVTTQNKWRTCWLWIQFHYCIVIELSKCRKGHEHFNLLETFPVGKPRTRG